MVRGAVTLLALVVPSLLAAAVVYYLYRPPLIVLSIVFAVTLFVWADARRGLRSRY